MSRTIIRRKEARQRALVFYNDNLPDLGTNLILVKEFGTIANQLVIIEAAMEEKASAGGDASQRYDHKGTEREDLRSLMQPIARTARRMDSVVDGISEKYRMPSSRSDQTLLATAKAWATDLVAVEDDFVAFGLPATFIADLSTAATAFEDTINPTSDAVDDRIEANANIAESDRIGMEALRICDVIVRNIFAGNPGKIAAWTSASHVERA